MPTLLSNNFLLIILVTIVGFLNQACSQQNPTPTPPSLSITTVIQPIFLTPFIPPTPTSNSNNESWGTVTRVIDGDTIDVNINGAIQRVRYIGINTPETNEVCGHDATQANTALVANQQVRLVKDISEVDRYGRLLRYIYVGDLFINAELVKQGWAEAVAYPPDTLYADHFEELETQARSDNLNCYATTIFNNSDSPTTLSTPTAILNTPPITGTSVCNCSGNIHNCAAFSTHDQAQACFNYCLQTVGYDVHRLDRDKDRLACEALP